jgi:hypothetical protein
MTFGLKAGKSSVAHLLTEAAGSLSGEQDPTTTASVKKATERIMTTQAR